MVDLSLNNNSSMDAKEAHPLLEDKIMMCSPLTFRRAFIIWLHFGRTDNFNSVCTFYYHLEKMERKLSPNERAARRRREFDLYSRNCPNCHYPSHPMLQYRRRADISITTLGDYSHPTRGVTNEITDTSKLVKKFCHARNISFKQFHYDFIDFARICEQPDTVINVTLYIKRRVVLEELLMVEDYAKIVNLAHLDAARYYTNKLVSRMHQENSVRMAEQINYPTTLKSLPATKYDRDVTNQYWNGLTYDPYSLSPARNW